jgi:hypothetical protein
MAVVTLALAAVAGCGGDASQPTPAAKSTPAATATVRAPGTFVSTMLPYQLALPAGWWVDPASQGSGSDGDELISARGTERLVVGHGYPKPGETVADRVKVNRTQETAPGCASNSKQDRPIEVGGEHGILWSYSCAPDDKQLIPARDTYSLSAQTIYRRAGHRRVGYRFTVVVPMAKKTQAKPLLDRLLTGLTFLNKSAATGD